MFVQFLHLLSNDLAETKKFYHKLLQVTILKESAKHISFVSGHTVLTFHATDNGHPFYHFAFAIPNNKLEEAVTWIKERTTILPFFDTQNIADFTTWNAKAFYFHDNQQNILEFITHFDLQYTTPEPFTSASITGICEIGIVVENVIQACEQFHNNNHIPYFKNGPRLHDFAVMGDANGMFIVSKTGRGWLPTQRPAEQHWMKASIKNNDIKNEFVF